MKSQGLPINFIVIAALAILVLILAAGFVISGGTSATSTLGPTQVRNTCQGYCNVLQQKASFCAPGDTTCFDPTTEKYCTTRFNVQGYTEPVGCEELIPCVVTYNDGSTEKITCGTEATEEEEMIV